MGVEEPHQDRISISHQRSFTLFPNSPAHRQGISFANHGVHGAHGGHGARQKTQAFGRAAVS